MIKKLFFIIPALTPLYLIKISLFGLPTNVFEILAVAALILTFPQWKNITLRKFWRENNLFCWGILFIIFGIITSLLHNKTYAVSLGILKSWFLLPIIFSYILYLVLKNKDDVLFVLKSMYVSLFAVALIGIFYKLAHVVTFDGRLQAFYNSPNYLAMFLAPGIFLGWFFLKASWKNNLQKYLYLLSLLAIMLSLYFTYSYAAWIAIAGSFMLVFFINYSTNVKNVRVVAVFLLICFILLVTQIHNPKFSSLLQNNPHSSFASREMIWQSSTKMLADSPLFGIGAGNFQNTYLAYQKYFPPYLEWAVPEPHNLLLAFWLESGLVGLIGFVMVVFYVFYTLVKLIKKRRDAGLAFVFVAILLYILIHGLADTTYWKNDLSFLFWLFAFCSLFIARESKIDTK